MEGCNDWKYSVLNTKNLNVNFLNNIGTTWSNMIANSKWNISGSSSYNLTAKNMFVAEIINATKTYGPSDGVSKIGLVYVSDYGYAAAPSAWTTNMNSYIGSAVTSVNWMYSGLSEWTISPSSSTSTIYSIYISDVGNSSIISTNNIAAVRPVFYLNSSVFFVSGLGTSSSPIRIGN